MITFKMLTDLYKKGWKELPGVLNSGRAKAEVTALVDYTIAAVDQIPPKFREKIAEVVTELRRGVNHIIDQDWGLDDEDDDSVEAAAEEPTPAPKKKAAKKKAARKPAARA